MFFRPRPHGRVRRGVAPVVGVLTLGLAAAGCTAVAEDGTSTSSPQADQPAAAPSSTAPPVSQAQVGSNLGGARRSVSVDTMLKLKVTNGSFNRVVVRSLGEEGHRIKGSMNAADTRWTSKERLEPGTRYRTRTVAVDSKGITKHTNRHFRTDDLTLDQQTYPSIAPLEGETVGVGMPVVVKFDIGVTDKKAIERHLSVQTTPKQAGSWHWLSDNEVHWRPRHYWKPGSDVTVDADINSIPAGPDLWGQKSRSTSFHVGNSVVNKVNLNTHQMRTLINGDLAKTIPISGGKKHFRTRSGVKVIVNKKRHKHMDAATIGISKSSAEYYDLDDVEYSMRVTYSGEFLHAAPWSRDSQGVANTSHGCVGMSTANARWVFNHTHGRGDIVDVTGSQKYMTLGNGYGDWNESFAEYKQGSALRG